MSNSSALPTSAKLSRGKKGFIQRIFVGESNKDQVVVYKYNITTKYWYREYTISSPSPSFSKFGFSLAGTDDASILAVGDPGTSEGRVCVFQKDNTGNGWSERCNTIAHPLLSSSGSQSDGFGHSVALSQYDGNILVVGAPFYNVQTPAFATVDLEDFPVSEGRVFIFKWNGSSYSIQQTISSPSGTLTSSYPDPWKNFYFGHSLGISDIGNMIIIGCPSIRHLDNIAKNNEETKDIFFDISVYDEYYSAIEVSDLETGWGHTGNAHVYHNHTVLSGGTTWTSNVNVTEVIGVTSVGGITVDVEPEKIRPLECVGTSVGMNRAGTRIFATAPYSYGTSNASPQIFSGRIYTLEWNSVTGTWDEMGTIHKHINSGINFRLLGFSAEFDGSGNRIVAGAPEWVSISRKLRGQIEIFDWNGDAWVSYPTSIAKVVTNTNQSFYGFENLRFGDSVSIDGEGEMIAIGMGDNNNPNYSGNIPRPSQFSVYGITYIGGATETIAGSDSHILTGTSNVWVYNVPQSMIVSGNMTVSGCLQTAGIAVGSNDDTDTSRKTIFFGGTKADNSYDYTVIENRLYESAEKSELLIFKGDNNADFYGSGIYGPDRIRLKSGQISFDLDTGYERDTEDIRFVMNKSKLQGGKFGVNTVSPTEAIDVSGKIKCSQGFIGRGKELIDLDLHNSLIKTNENTGVAGSSYNNDLILGEMSTISSSTTYPTVNLTANASLGYLVLSSFDDTNAWKAFDSSYNSFSGSWQLDTGSADGSQGTVNYVRFGPDIGYYLGNTERFPGYPGEWIEIQMASSVPKLLLTEVLINVPSSGSLPLNLHVFGSNNGTEYQHIHTEIKTPPIVGAIPGTPFSVFTRTPSINDTAYNKFVFICTRVSTPYDGVYWSDLRFKGQTLSAFTSNLKLDKTGKIGIGTTNPAYHLDVAGDVNFTGELSVNGTVGNAGQVLTSSGPGFSPAWTTVSSGSTGGYWTQTSSNIYYISGFVGIGTTAPNYTLDINGTTNFSDTMYLSGSAGTSGQVLTSSGPGSAPTWTSGSGGGSYWTQTNSNIYYTTGNVGIGTSTPNHDLDVHGLINFTGTLYQNGDVYFNNGNVKIGSSSQANYDLDVAGDINFTGELSVNGSVGSSGQVLTSSGTGSAPTWTTISGGGGSSLWSTSGTSIYYNLGTVGIGTANPAYTLDVIGPSNPSLPLARFSSATDTYIKIDSGAANAVLTFEGVYASNSVTIGQTFNYTSTHGMFVICDGYSFTSPQFCIDMNTSNVGIGTINPAYLLDVAGNVNFTGELSVNGSVGSSGQVLTSSGPGSAPTWTSVSGGSTSSTVWSTSGTNVHYNNGNVGIGTTNPNYKLHVAGTSNFTGELSVNGSVGTSGQVLTSTGPGSAPTWTTVSSSYWTTSGSDIYYNTGNIGIGITNPAYHLDVAGDINFTGELSVNGSVGTSGQVLTSGGAGSAPTWTTVSGGTGSSYWTQTGSGSNIYYTLGNVGIGTMNPNYKLDVTGTSNFTGEMRVNGSVGTSGQVLTSSGAGSAPTWTTVSGGGGGSSYWTQSGLNIYYTTGNVGIANTAPTNTLDIGSNVSVIDDGVDKLVIRGNVYSTHDIIATSFRGDGSNLTGVTASSITSEASRTISISTVNVLSAAWLRT